MAYLAVLTFLRYFVFHHSNTKERPIILLESGATMAASIDLRWFLLSGLACDFLGAVFIAYGLMISKEKAIELSVSRYSSDHDMENLEQPQVKDRLKQSWNAKIGVALLAIGFVLQLVANWPR